MNFYDLKNKLLLELLPAVHLAVEKLRGDSLVHSRAVLREVYEKAPGRERLACKPGCAHCCRNYLTVTATDVLLAAGYVQQHFVGDDLQRLRTMLRHGHKAEVTSRDPATAKPPPVCPFLREEACTIYPQRPGVCAGHTSEDVKQCEVVRAATDAGKTDPIRFDLPIEPLRAEVLEEATLDMLLGGTGIPVMAVYHFWGAVEALLADGREASTWDPQVLRRALRPFLAYARLEPTAAAS